jgi:hypothetical protein
MWGYMLDITWYAKTSDPYIRKAIRMRCSSLLVTRYSGPTTLNS